MNLIPVIDLKNGQAVHAKAGLRDLYQPLTSVLFNTTSLSQFCASVGSEFENKYFYLADLDRIERVGDHTPEIQQLLSTGFHWLLDLGVSNEVDLRTVLRQLESWNNWSLVLGSESIVSFNVVTESVIELGRDRVWFSADIRENKLVAGPWTEGMEFREIISTVHEASVGNMILLDLTCVGTGRQSLMERVPDFQLSRRPELKLVVGGGLSGISDLTPFASAGCSGFLMATALYDGRMTGATFRQWKATAGF